MIEMEIKVPYDLVGRKALVLQQNLSHLKSSVYFQAKGSIKKVNGKSLIGILSMGLKKGDCILMTISGNSSAQDSVVIENLILKGKG